MKSHYTNPALGAEGRTFESCHPDHLISLTYGSSGRSIEKTSLLSTTPQYSNLPAYIPHASWSFRGIGSHILSKVDKKYGASRNEVGGV